MQSFLKLSFSYFFLLSSLSCSATTLHFKQTKIGGWSLRYDFLHELNEIFKAEIFIESGTSYGGTTKVAKEIFKTIHTIELDEKFFKKAELAFITEPNIKVYYGDSAEVLPSILKSVKNKKIFFWLDGHFSGGTTARGKHNSPILGELKAIAASGIKDGIIMIDDMCCFHPDTQDIPDVAIDYPTVNEVRDALLTINPGYEIIMYGDIAIAYPSTFDVKLSPLIQAMTVSRFFSKDSMSYAQVFDAEGLIASQTTATELEALWDQCTYHFEWHRTYPYLWYALALFSQDRYAEAYDNFLNVIETGYHDWRVYWYAMQAAYRSSKPYDGLAKEMFKQNTNLVAAQCFLKQLHS